MEKILKAIVIFLFIPFCICSCRSSGVTNKVPPQVVEIWVNPGMVNLKNQGQLISVYTRLIYNEVAKGRVMLNGLSIGSWPANREGGYSVKFSDSAIKALSLPSGTFECIVTMEGEKKDGTQFSGSAAITVVNDISEN